MSENLKISEAELSIFMNKMSSYSKFLYDNLEQYKEKLDLVLKLGIKDEEITNALLDFQSNIIPLASSIERSSKFVKYLSNMFVTGVETKDKFKYSDDGMSNLISTLSVFL